MEYQNSLNFFSASFIKKTVSSCKAVSPLVNIVSEISNMCNAKISALYFFANIDAACMAVVMVPTPGPPPVVSQTFIN